MGLVLIDNGDRFPRFVSRFGITTIPSPVGQKSAAPSAECERDVTASLVRRVKYRESMITLRMRYIRRKALRFSALQTLRNESHA